MPAPTSAVGASARWDVRLGDRRHRDLAWLGLLCARDVQAQHAVLERRRGVLDVQAGRQRQRAAAGAAADLTVDAFTLATLALGLLLDGDGQRVLVDGDLDVLRTDTRQRRLDGDGILAGRDIQGQSRLREVAPGQRSEDRFIEEAVDRVAERPQVGAGDVLRMMVMSWFLRHLVSPGPRALFASSRRTVTCTSQMLVP